METRDIQHIRKSFDAVGSRIDPLVDEMYAKLFEIRPDIAGLFPSNLIEQRAHFSGALMFLVRNIDKLDTIDIALRAMGTRHKRYGVELAHFAAFKEALVFAMNTILGDDWTQEAQHAWAMALDEVSGIMMAGSSPRNLDEAA